VPLFGLSNAACVALDSLACEAHVTVKAVVSGTATPERIRGDSDLLYLWVFTLGLVNTSLHTSQTNETILFGPFGDKNSCMPWCLVYLGLWFLSASAHPVLWVGGVTSNQASFRAVGYYNFTFAVSLNEDLSEPGYSQLLTSSTALITVCFLS
jgi:hypothetical protein